MNIADLQALVADSPTTALLLTEPDHARPGPIIVHANAAFEALSGYRAEEAIGRSPRFLQGPETNRLATMAITRALRRREPIAECLANYHRGGAVYLCALEIHPIYGASGRLDYFAAFERAVVRRRGRPRAGFAGRYVPVDPLARLPSEASRLFAA
ncbi:PAS domain-containing protein [Salinarimonas sp.]|uniref:PAS domain-containing protein n=1 Tax=Salinarimonas sp. TaxID=2766526 RepID=UPI0039199C14